MTSLKLKPRPSPLNLLTAVQFRDLSTDDYLLGQIRGRCFANGEWLYDVLDSKTNRIVVNLSEEFVAELKP